MYAAERQRGIYDLARQKGRVSVAGLAREFDVTTETIRRDLDYLNDQGVLRRVHGGAVIAQNVELTETGLAAREPTHAAQKNRIAAAAMEFLPGAAGSLLVDAGTTTARVAAMLTPESARTVITGSVPVAGQLINNGLNLQLLGGRVRGITGAAVGADTVAAISKLRCDVAFIGVNGLSLTHGLSTPDADEAAVKQAMVNAAKHVIVLADSSKIGAELLVSFAAISDVDVLVTDAGVATNDCGQLEAAGVQVVIA